jgi:glycosyltransferase involved in cell wall biosynthesis
MPFHFLLPRAMNLPEAAAQAARRLAPRQGTWELARRLGAEIHEPAAEPAHGADVLRSRLAPPDAMWSLARRVLADTGPRDTVFCPSEAGGLQFAAVCEQAGRTRPRLAVFVHNVDRPRARFALKWWHMARSIDLFLACSSSQVHFLRSFLGLPSERARLVWDHTDLRFFAPGPPSPDKRRPVIASVGLEQRDYKTLAAASHDLDVDVRISGFSKDAAALARTFPSVLPANMTRRFYEWPELVQLYRDADVVVVSCHENRYAAGVQGLMEAMACRRPVIATATRGLAAYLHPSVIAVPPGDAVAMRDAIRRVLADPAGAEARARDGHAHAQRTFDLDRYVDTVGGALGALT